MVCGLRRSEVEIFMRIDGKSLALKILADLKKKIAFFDLHPTLLVILLGDDPASLSYVKQKQKSTDFLGAKLIIKNLAETVRRKELLQEIEKANQNPKINGIIVQLPLPKHLDTNLILPKVALEKDVDGFAPNSPFTSPVAGAVLKVLEEIKHLGWWQAERSEAMTPPRWTEKNFLVIGRGLTGGKPIAETLKKLGYQISVAHSQTSSKELAALIRTADVVVSCVGKPAIFKAKNLKPGAVVIGVGVHRELSSSQGEHGQPKWTLVGDFNEEEISKKVSFYTPTPGGIGPLNVTCLMENLVEACLNLKGAPDK